MNILNASPSDFQAVATLHAQGIDEGFLSTLGAPFLIRLYHAISQAPGSLLLVAKNDEKKVVGFVAGTLNTKKMYLWILKRDGLHFFVLLSKYIFRLSTLKKIIETLLYSVKNKKAKADETPSAPLPELLSIAVDASARNRHVGSDLVQSIESYFLRKNVHSYKVVTAAANQVSTTFYLKGGFKLNRQYLHHENLMNEYCKSI